MSNGKHLQTVNNKKVVDFELGADLDPTLVYRIRTTYETPSFEEHLEEFFTKANISELEELIIGAWNENIGEGWELDMKAIVEQKDKLPNLKYLMIGDVTQDESEMSWIEHGQDYRILLDAFPNLTFFGIRQGSGAEIKHEKLETLIIEATGLNPDCVTKITKSQLPNLEHLSIWLGTEDRGEVNIETLNELFSGNFFPKLKYLGLNNSDKTDEIAKMLLDAPLLDRLETLDLSGGTLGDEGAAFLLSNPKIAKLKMLNLSHHYLSPEIQAKLEILMGDRIDVSNAKPEGRYGRYVQVGE